MNLILAENLDSDSESLYNVNKFTNLTKQQTSQAGRQVIVITCLTQQLP